MLNSCFPGLDPRLDANRSPAVLTSVGRWAKRRVCTARHDESQRDKAEAAGDMYDISTCTPHAHDEMSPVSPFFTVSVLLDLTIKSGRFPSSEAYHVQDVLCVCRRRARSRYVCDAMPHSKTCGGIAASLLRGPTLAAAEDNARTYRHTGLPHQLPSWPCF